MCPPPPPPPLRWLWTYHSSDACTTTSWTAKTSMLCVAAIIDNEPHSTNVAVTVVDLIGERWPGIIILVNNCIVMMIVTIGPHCLYTRLSACLCVCSHPCLCAHLHPCLCSSAVGIMYPIFEACSIFAVICSIDCVLGRSIGRQICLAKGVGQTDRGTTGHWNQLRWTTLI